MPWKTVEMPLDLFSSGADVLSLEELTDYGPEDIIKITGNEQKKDKSKLKKVEKVKKTTDADENGCSGQKEIPKKKVLEKQKTLKKKTAKRRKIKKDKHLISLANVVDVCAEVSAADSQQRDGKEEKSVQKAPSKSSRKTKSTASSSAVEKAMTKWDGLGLPKEILSALYEDKFLSPTEIQQQAIPAALGEYRDVIGAAETGSGKTLAYGLPLLTHIFNKIQNESVIDDDSDADVQRPLGLVLVPTRELAVQVKQHLDTASRFCDGLTIGLIVGGLSVEKQQRILNFRPSILVATPGRLWQLVRDKTPGLDQISRIRYLVVDEADRIVEKAHFAELKKLIQHISNNQPERQKRQTLLFSATLTFAQYDLKNRATAPAVLQDKLRNLMESLSMKNRPKIVDLSPTGTTTRSLVEAKVVCEGGDVEKDAVLYSILSQYPGRTLVFANAITTVRRISNMLRLLFSPPKFGKHKKAPQKTTRPILLLHAQLRQRVRLKYLDRFRDEPNAILVASDVAARGLDIQNIEHVVHYHVPNNAESYVHRSGRTARLLAEGLSILLVDPKVESGRFWRLMANLCRRATSEEAKAADVVDLEIDRHLLGQCRERVQVCRQLESLAHQQKKVNADKRWLMEAGSDFESSSSDNNSDEDYVDSDKLKNQQTSAAMRQLEVQLGRLLTLPLKIRPDGSVTRYPSQLGQAISVDTTSAALENKETGLPTIRAIDHINKMSKHSKKGSLAKQVALAAKIERRKAKRQEKSDKLREEKAKKRDEKRNEKRKKKEDEEAAGNGGDKEFVFY